ncbi:hypothetical protein DMUE_3097 [Dictyocoela muelleri]|nr:hypothetical protein DMUE_3097 [Dictyocoela muelleri]
MRPFFGIFLGIFFTFSFSHLLFEFINNEKLLVDSKKLQHCELIRNSNAFCKNSDESIRIDILNKEVFEKFLEFINGPVFIKSEREIADLIYLCDFFDVQSKSLINAIKNIASFTVKSKSIRINGRVEAFIRANNWQFFTFFLSKLFLYPSIEDDKCVIRYLNYLNDFSLYKNETNHIHMTSGAVKILCKYYKTWFDVLSYLNIDKITINDRCLFEYFRDFIHILPEKLVYLDLSKCFLPINQISILIDEIDHKYLEHLDVSYSSLSYHDYRHIGKCKNLKKLLVNGCSGSLNLALGELRMNLKSLDAEDVPLKYEDYIKILRCANLEELNVNNCGLNLIFLDLLLDSEISSKIKRLCIDGNNINLEIASRFIFLEKIEILEFNGKNIHDSVLSELLRVDKLASLAITEMELTLGSYNGIYCPKMEHLSLINMRFNYTRLNFSAFPNLKSLKLSASDQLNYDDLLEIKKLKNLQVLEINDLNDIFYNDQVNDPNAYFKIKADSLNKIVDNNISELNVGYNNFTLANKKTLKDFRKLKKLCMEYSEISYINFELPNSLVNLNLSFNNISSGMLIRLENLKILDISQSFVENYDFLLADPFRKKLEALNVGNNVLLKEDIAIISRLSLLKELCLSYAIIETLEPLKNAQYLVNRLETIDLSGLTIYDSDLRILSKFRNLKILKMNNCNFRGRGVRVIVNSNNLRRSLNYVFLKNSNYIIKDLEDLKIINRFVDVIY